MVNALMGGWPSGTGNASYPQEPSANMLLGRVLGHPAGTQRACSDAERLLSQAVGWWDAAYYREGDRFLRNRGTGSELLDLRLGSSFAANSNDPLYLAPEDAGHVYFPVSGNVAVANDMRVANSSAFTVTTSLVITVQVSVDDYSSQWQTICAKHANNVSGDSWIWYRNSTVWVFQWRDASQVARTTEISMSGVPSGKVWLRLTWLANDAGVYRVKHEWSRDQSTWTTTTNAAGASTGTIQTTTTSVQFGRRTTTHNLQGRFYRALIAVDGTTVLDVDCDAITSGSATSFTASTGQTVTINRSTSGRKAVAMPSKWNGGRSCFLLGTDDYLECQDTWQHQMLNFGQGDSFTVIAVVRQWATAANVAHLIAKRSAASTATAAGWNMNNGSSNDLLFRVCDGDTQYVVGTFARTLGERQVVSARREASSLVDIYLQTTVGSQQTLTRVAGNLDVTRIGRLSGAGTNFGDFEFTAAAVFRRALTPDEIATITRHYTGA